jgi:hypothetical protein
MSANETLLIDTLLVVTGRVFAKAEGVVARTEETAADDGTCEALEIDVSCELAGQISKSG